MLWLVIIYLMKSTKIEIFHRIENILNIQISVSSHVATMWQVFEDVLFIILHTLHNTYEKFYFSHEKRITTEEKRFLR